MVVSVYHKCTRWARFSAQAGKRVFFCKQKSRKCLTPSARLRVLAGRRILHLRFPCGSVGRLSDLNTQFSICCCAKYSPTTKSSSCGITCSLSSHLLPPPAGGDQHVSMTENVKHANMESVKENITESGKRNPAAAQLYFWKSLHLKKYILVLQSDVRCVIIEKTEQTF